MTMVRIEETYNNLKYQKIVYEIELRKKKQRLSDIQEKKKNIIIKRIHGELYYYAQYREEGKVKSEYLSPVGPGRIAEEEQIQSNIDQLTKEIDELEWDVESLNKVLSCLKKRIRRENVMNDFSFEVYWKDEITARVYVKKENVIVSRYTDNPGKQLFAEKKMTRYQLGKILELRCVEKGRADIDEILEHLGLDEYNPYEIVRKTHGVSYNDYIWFRFPGEKLTSKDVLVR